MRNKKTMSELSYSLKILPLLETTPEWHAYLNEEADPEISFAFHRNDILREENGRNILERQPNRIIDAYVMRERFFEIRTAKDAHQFFSEFGPMALNTRPGVLNEAPPCKLSQVFKRQEFYRNALLVNYADPAPHSEDVRRSMETLYLRQPLSLKLGFRQPMHAVARCSDVEMALRAAVFLDRLRGLPWKLCAREDCGKPFELHGKIPTLYCSAECAHLQATRHYSARKQKARLEAKKTAAKKTKTAKADRP